MDVEHLPMSCLVVWASSFETHLFRSFARLKTGWLLLCVELCELLVYWRSSPLSDVWFAHIFSCCIRCLSCDRLLCSIEGFYLPDPPGLSLSLLPMLLVPYPQNACPHTCHDAHPPCFLLVLAWCQALCLSLCCVLR